MERIIIGTAGHIDHGKTALVKAMTGIDTDRLKEEKKRGISIELGFAPLRLPGGQQAGLVDVPGHERFIRQMLAGASGMDLVLLVIAADEGIMPQTREHLDIINLLGIEHGIVVLTKKDLVEEEWLLMVQEEVREYLNQNNIRDWPMIAVSSTTGENIPELLGLIQEVAKKVQAKKPEGFARLPVDRVFTMPGFGTVVTGTLWSGTVNVNDIMEILPQGLTTRVRHIQVHGQKVETAKAGQRVALNLQGVEVSQIKRGSVLATPGSLKPTMRVNASLKLLESSPRPLKNWARIRFHLGTEEALGRVVLLQHDELLPGEQGYVQIVLEKPVVCRRNDRYVVRFYSPMITIGGGLILDPHPAKQKRFNEEVLRHIAIQEEGDIAEVLIQEMDKSQGHLFSLEELVAVSQTTENETQEVLDELIQQGMIEKIVVDGKELYLSRRGLALFRDRVVTILEDYHKKYPLRQGYPREEMRTRHFKEYTTKSFATLLSVLEKEGEIKIDGTLLTKAGFSPQPEGKAKQASEEVLRILREGGLSPCGEQELRDIIAKMGEDPEEILSYLEGEKKILKIAEGMYFAVEAVNNALEELDRHFSSHKQLTLGEARDLWKTSRKYALPLLEYFDTIKVTKRIGDVRVRMEK